MVESVRQRIKEAGGILTVWAVLREDVYETQFGDGFYLHAHGLALNSAMDVQSGDLIHADRHGAVVVPVKNIDAMAAALDSLMKREARIIAAARAPGATAATIKAAMKA